MNTLKGSRVYTYHEKHPENQELYKIILTANGFSRSENRVLLYIYQLMMRGDLINIINYLISGSNDDNEDIIICYAAIVENNFNIINILISKKFNFSKKIDPNHFGFIHSGDILGYAFVNGTPEMIELLMSNGAIVVDPNSIISACRRNIPHILENILSMNLTKEMMDMTIAALCENNNTEMITYLINKGYNVKENSKFLHTNISTKLDYGVALVKFFIDYGLDMDSSYPLLLACQWHNLSLIEFYLEYGLKVDQEILDYVFDNFKIEIIGLFIKYSVDFSGLEVRNLSNTASKFLAKLESNGMDKVVLLSILLKFTMDQKTDYQLIFNSLKRIEKYL